jgi:hypothetical protein
LRPLERESRAQHAGLLLPAGKLIRRTRRFRIEAAHHAEALRVQARRLDDEIVALAFP